MRQALHKKLSFYTKKWFFIGVFCVGTISVGKSQNASNLYETFFVGEDGLQYFIKPLRFEHASSQSALEIDFTFRYKNAIKDSININMFLIDANALMQIDSLRFSNHAEYSITAPEVVLLFTEKQKKAFYSRFASRCSLAEVRPLFDQSNWTVTVYLPQGISREYTAPAKTTKNLATLYEAIFTFVR